MPDIARRFEANPLLKPSDLIPSTEGLEITCLLNPGVFQYQNKIWLIVRVAERPKQKEGIITFPILTETDTIKIMEIHKSDPELIETDARVINYKGQDYLTTLSHLRLLCSEDGVHFYEPEGYTPLMGRGRQESFGIEDCRVCFLENTYHLTYTAVSINGVGVSLKTTKDWKTFDSAGMIFPPHNKDCAVFCEKVGGKYFALHRPSSVEIGGNFIWLAESPDGVHWGNHRCILKTREGAWDSSRIGAGAAPIKNSAGWLEIYHGADNHNRYCLGAFLLDLEDPSIVLARTEKPIMIPVTDYETSGFFSQVVFTNGHFVHPDGDTVTVYYGASDEFVCGADFSINEIISYLNFEHA